MDNVYVMLTILGILKPNNVSLIYSIFPHLFMIKLYRDVFLTLECQIMGFLRFVEPLQDFRYSKRIWNLRSLNFFKHLGS